MLSPKPTGRLQSVVMQQSNSEDQDRREQSILKNVKLRIHLEDLKHKSIPSFTGLIDLQAILPNATKHVLWHLYRPHGKPPALRSITLVLEGMDGVAYTTGIALDDMHKEIHLSLDYISRNIGHPALFRDETIGVIVHEMVHCWQHNCCGTAPGGLIEGIADYVRLKSGLAPPHWKKTKEERGTRWDEGYQKTAWFLEWLEDQHGVGSISRMNDLMDGKVYEEKNFWATLFGDTVDSLWKKYVKYCDEKDAEHTKPASVSSAEVVELNDEEKAEARKQEGEQNKIGKVFNG